VDFAKKRQRKDKYENNRKIIIKTSTSDSGLAFSQISIDIIIMKIDGYKFGNKNNWRRWVWNRISERYRKPKSEAIIVYLAGTEDLDRKIALEHGFKPYNMIAVDRDINVVEALRTKGALAIQGDLFEVLKGFSGTQCRINILIADICCGVSDDIYNFAKYMVEDETANIFDFETGIDTESDFFDENDESLESFNKLTEIAFKDEKYPVIMFNLMRGRDKGIILDEFKQANIKHRGELLIETMCKIRKQAAEVIFNRVAKNENRELNELEKSYISNMHACCLEETSPDYTSYKSCYGNIVMDSVVFNAIPPDILLCEKVSNEMTKKVSATLAIRTMKMNGQLKPCPMV